MRNRIYGEKISLSTEMVKAFWSKRSSMYEEKGLNATFCGNQNLETALKETEFDQEYIIPRLGLTKASRVIDMGCGIGRFAKMMLPRCGFYCGVDYTQGMIQVTEQVCREIIESGSQAGSYSLHHLSVSETVERDPAFLGGPFDVFVMWGVGMYMNDAELEHTFRLIPRLMKDHAIILLQESMGLGKRLTLDQFPSESLESTYSAIYRTKEEYKQIYSPLFEAGFSYVEEAQLPDFGNPYPDSERRYCIMKRG